MISQLYCTDHIQISANNGAQAASTESKIIWCFHMKTCHNTRTSMHGAVHDFSDSCCHHDR